MCQKKPYCNREIDECIREAVAAINRTPHLRTILSCCGHGVYPPTIIVQDISNGYYKAPVYEYFSNVHLGLGRRRTYYRRDQNGFYYVLWVSKEKI